MITFLNDNLLLNSIKSQKMKAQKDNKLSLKQATKRLSALMGEQLDKVPPKERRKRIESAYKKLLARLKSKKHSSGELSKESGRAASPMVRLVARSRS